jgi:hypothetical protein
LLPRSVDIVHFIDDDVTLQPGYFDRLAEALRRHSRLDGVGGLITTPNGSCPRPPVRYRHRLFLLRTDQPSRVLSSPNHTGVADRRREHTACRVAQHLCVKLPAPCFSTAPFRSECRGPVSPP